MMGANWQADPQRSVEEKFAWWPIRSGSHKRIWLKNDAYLVDKNLYVAGTLAGGRSQFAIACGSGAQVATDILTLWNNGIHTKHHDKIKR